ncbi:MAG: NAD-dependent epimerase/dehydratase family protein [Thiocapsa sp.]|uniref:NAD-dependent epimerase/dehydratase family protein n=1 Tax=Thiocapsa sp. TaxID=2024551 RepID=UPI001BCB2276|nr:NAD-dependent epimerase/dehydratase family protein [Thiocapsa sp.]QVL50316.1 MAG: NAD-dependent epimerase/dehydratase family protein [Thiocapsa sp.]
MAQVPSLASPKTAEEVVQTDLNYICKHLSEEFSALSSKNLLITGGAGFLGYYLVQAVLHWNKANPAAKPIHLTIYDNYIRGVPEWLTHLSGNPNLELLKHDITNPLPETIGNFQFIIHAASIASPTFYRKYPIETMDANVNGLRFLLEYCLQQKAKGNPVEGFLFYSTSEIYGDPTPESIPTPETYRGNVSCTGPRACYDESKRFGETLCVNFALQHDLPIKIARPFNNYGPGLKITDRRVLPDFARDIFNERDIVLLSDGSPTRTFCYIADAIVGYYKVLVKGHPGESYNVGVETPEISMANLAERVVGLARDLFDYRGQVVRRTSGDQDYLIDNPNRRCPIIDKARDHVGYNPNITIDDGLRRTIVWYSGNREAEDA